jgi:CRP-like cAMP-binding protein
MNAPAPRSAPVIALHRDGSPYHPQSQICVQCGVRQFALFAALDEAALQRLHYRIADVTLEPGQSLYASQAAGGAVYTVRSGVVRLERLSDQGEPRILRLAGRGDLLGLEALLPQPYAADAIACTPVQACRIPRVLIDELTQDQPGLSRDLMKRWQRALDDADEWLTELTRGSARHRMLRLLLKLSEFAEGDALVWMPTRQEMGAMLDLTVETTSRMVSALRREGVIEPVDARHARLAMSALLAALNDEPAGR